MDIISYGAASKAAKEEKKTREEVLGIGVEGSNPHVKGRIDLLEESIQAVNTQANKLILNDSINIMKAHAKLNAIAKTTKYKMHNMIFDDLLDLSGIDTTKSSGYTHDAVNGSITGGTVITKTEVADVAPKKAILNVETLHQTAPAKVTVLASQAFASGYYDTQYASEAFDGVTGNYNVWTANSNANVYLGVDFGANKKIINRYILKISSLQAPKSWRFEGSNDNSSWQVLDTQSGVTTTNDSSVYTKAYFISNTKAFRYYRIYITSNNGAAYYTTIAEMELYETTMASGTFGDYSVSRDNGETWFPITPNTLMYFDDKESSPDKNMRIKAVLPTGTQLLNYALTWA